MPRKGPAAELQAEEAVTNSPLRRSSRIVTGINGTPTAGVVTRRTSQTTESQAGTPAKVTRGRRTSTQDSEEKVETKAATRTRKSSILAEENSQKEAVSTPSRRGRKPSITTEPTEKEETEKPKPLRSRRTSAASTNEEPSEEKLSKTAPVRSRRSSANVDSETEVKVAPKTPARSISRRRSSAAENVIIEEVSTPAKRTTRGRKASGADEISETIEEVEKVTKRSRKKSVDIEDKDEESAKSEGRGRRTSTDSFVDSAPKTPLRPKRRASVNKESDTKDLSQEKIEDVNKESNTKDLSQEKREDVSEIQNASITNDGASTEEEMSPIVLTEVSIKVTPLKKRKIVEKMEAELDLSIINESSDDVDSSKQDESAKETSVKVNNEKDNKEVNLDMNKDIKSSTENNEMFNLSPQRSKSKLDTSPINSSLNSADNTNIEIRESNNEAPNVSSESFPNSPNKKISSAFRDDKSDHSPRKSPRLGEKSSPNTPTKKESRDNKIPTPRRSRNVLQENIKENNIDEKSQGSFISSGSDSSFKFHLSNISMPNSYQHDSHKEYTQEDLLNTSKESTGSSKENIEYIEPSNDKDISAIIDVQAPIAVARVSNVFKPNQKEYSFMEPMEVEEDSIISTETAVTEKNIEQDNSSVISKGKIPEVISCMQSTEVSTDNVVKKGFDFDESSVIFNSRAAEKLSEEKSTESDISEIISPKQQSETTHIQYLRSPAKDTLKQDGIESEHCSTNFIIQETQDTVDISIKPKTLEIEIPTITGAQKRLSPVAIDTSMIINQPLEQVKVGKSSSPIINRKSRSPVLMDANNIESESGGVPRRSKSKSPCINSPTRKLGENTDVLFVPKKSKLKSKTPSPSRATGSPKKMSRTPSPSNSRKSPTFISIDVNDEVKLKKSKSPIVTRSKSKSPLHKVQETPVAHESEKLGQRRSIRSKSKSPLPNSEDTRITIRSASKSPIPDLQEIPVAENMKPKSARSKSKSPVPDSQHAPIIQDGDKLKARRSIRSTLKSPVSYSQENLVTNSNDKLRINRSKSKSPLSDSKLLEQGFERPKGAEEIIVSNEKKSFETLENTEAKANIKDNFKKHFPDSVNMVLKTTESELEVSNVNFTESDQTNIQDKSDCHAAIATTCSESDFNTILNIDSEIKQSQVKESESPHYDFDLDSDDDLETTSDCSRVVGIETSLLEKQTRALRKNLENQSQVVMELKKFSKSKSKSSEDECKRDKPVIEDVKLDESYELNVTSEITSDQSSDDVKTNKEDLFKDGCSSLDHSVKDEQYSTDSTRSEKNSKDNSVNTSKGESSDSNKQLQEVEIKDTNDSNNADCIGVETDNQKISEKDNEKDNIGLDISLPKEDENKKDYLGADMYKDKNTGCNYEIKKLSEQADKKIIASDKNIQNVVENNSKTNSETGKIHNVPTSDISETLADEISRESSKKKGSDHNKRKKDKKKDQDEEEVEIVKEKPNAGRNQQEEMEDNFVEVVSKCKMATEKVEISKIDHSKPKLKEESKPIKSKITLGAFAAAKLEEYLNSKAAELQEETSSEEESKSERDEESDSDYNEFIDGMAEEGEEDTPSEDSNQIIDEGESIGSTSEEVSEDEFDSDDSFICDEEELELLSGDEYDLGDDKKSNKTKKRRIIDPSTLGDEDIIKVPQKKKLEKEKPKKRSRIITVSDSSDEEQIANQIKKDSDNEEAKHIKKHSDASVILIEDSANLDGSNKAIITEESKDIEESKPVIFEESKNEGVSEAITNEESEIVDSSKQIPKDNLSIKNTDYSVVVEEESNNEPVFHNISLANLNDSIQKRNRRSSLSIQENIVVDGMKDPLITKRISSLVESFCATVKKGEISLNLSLEYEGTEGTSQEKDKTEVVHILSDIQLCPGKPPIPGEEKVEVVDTEEKESTLSTSFNKTEDLREVLKKKALKRRLSKSMNDIYEEVKASKRRKKNNKTNEKSTSEEKLTKHTANKGKKRHVAKIHPAEKLTAISSFSIMNQLITDVKNRPKRTMKPTKTDVEVEKSWVTARVTNLKPSTSPVAKKEKIKIQPKLHPKDFKNQMLTNDKRVKRIDTKTLLKKKGAYS